MRRRQVARTVADMQPARLNPLVVDLYHGDPVKDFGRVKAAGIAGVIHKATQGTLITDAAYATRRDAARQAGLLFGAYHFMSAGDATQQVEHFLKVADPDDDLLVALDYETSSSSPRLDQCRTFLEQIEQKLGRKAVLYSGERIKATLPGKDDFFASHRLWLSEYGPVARCPASWASPWLWQFTGDGIGPLPHSVDGIPRIGVDLNHYDGTPEQLAAEWAV